MQKPARAGTLPAMGQDGPQSAPRARVLIVTASVGAGHNSAARAIAEALALSVPEVHSEVLDVLTFAPWAFRAYYAGGYSLAVTKLPSLYGLGFWLTDRPNGPRRGWMERFRLCRERRKLRAFERHVAAAGADLVVNTHFLAPPLLGRMRDTGLLAAPQFVVVTDIRMHRFWFAEGVDRWFVPAGKTAERLADWAVPTERVTVSGMPIHPKWSEPLDRRKILADWRLPEGRPIVLVSAGADFTCGPVLRIVKGLLSGCEGAFVAVAAGRNKKLLGRLSRLPATGRDLAAFSFTDRIHELVEVSSLVVTKAGGLTTAECLSKARPMVLLRPVPGQESGNAAYLAQEGAAVMAAGAADTVEQVRRLLARPDELDRLSDNARRLYRPGAETIAAAIRATVVEQRCGGGRG